MAYPKIFQKIVDHEAATAPHSAVSTATANRIALRDASGRLQVADPSADLDAVNKRSLASGSVPPTRNINTTAPLGGGGPLSADRTLTVSNATTSAVGVIQLATSAEATAGTVTNKAVTPSALKSALAGVGGVPATRNINTTAPLGGGGPLSADRTLTVSNATTSAVGVIQLATSAETTAGTVTNKAVTPSALKSALSSAEVSVAGKLKTGRTIRTDLASATAVLFDGSANVTPGVSGVLPITNGGHGGTSAATARTNLGAVNIAGDTMTGSLGVRDAGDTSRSTVASGSVTAPVIDAYNSRATALHHPYIRFRPRREDGTVQASTAYIQGVSDLVNNPVAGTATDPALLIRSGGMLYCGSGESPNNVRGAASGATAIPVSWELFTTKIFDDTEQAFFSSDSHMYFVTNANTIANAKLVQLNTGGSLLPGQNAAQNLGSTTFRWNNVYAKTLNVESITATDSNFAPVPKIGSGVGQIVNMSEEFGLRFGNLTTASSLTTLPAGGTWLYLGWKTTEHTIQMAAGIYPGGTTGLSMEGAIAWRIA